MEDIAEDDDEQRVSTVNPKRRTEKLEIIVEEPDSVTTPAMARLSGIRGSLDSNDYDLANRKLSAQMSDVESRKDSEVVASIDPATQVKLEDTVQSFEAKIEQ